MKIIRTEKQKDSMAKAFWDMGKVIFTVLVVSPLAKPEAMNFGSIVSGILVGVCSWLLGYILEGMEVKI